MNPDNKLPKAWIFCFLFHSMTESHCLAYCLGRCSNKTRSRKLQFSFKQLMYFLLVVMNQKYQKVFGGEKAIKKRFLVSLSFRDLRWEVPWINKEPCQTEQSPRSFFNRKSPALPSQQEATLGMWAGYSWAVWRQFG